MDLWQKRYPYWLAPLAGIYRFAVWFRRYQYHKGWKTIYRLPVPIIIIGNISIGGSGKTPLVIWLAEFLRKQGLYPGIISRGYGGIANNTAQLVKSGSNPNDVSDEAVMLIEATKCPMAIGVDRVAAANLLIKYCAPQVIISDDGLQHYALGRDIEIVVIDGVRRFGNGGCLPAGPLREPIQRLKEVDFLVSNGKAQTGEWEMQLKPNLLYNVVNADKVLNITDMLGKVIHAVAGIGNPQRFFLALKKMGFTIIEHPFPDHYRFSAQDINFADNLPVIMTHKDAVKCKYFADPRHWYLSIETHIDPAFGMEILNKLPSLKQNTHKN